jgi:O-antigen/teichoic acid export membrane protein
VGGGQILQVVGMFVLVRLLTPTDFGTVALGLTLVFALAHLQESGLGSALVYMRDDPRRMAPSVLAFAAAGGATATVVVALGAPLYTSLLHSPQSTGVVRALSLMLLIRGLTVVPAALLERAIDFRKRSRAELSGAFVQVTVSITTAVAGLGAWSLVAGQLSGSSVQLVVLWMQAAWRPTLRGASWTRLRPMLRYGRYVAASNIVNLVNSTIDNLTVGRFLGTTSLGFYAAAWRLAEMPTVVIGAIVGKVMFSVYSKLQHDIAAVRREYVGNVQRTILLALPVTVGLGIAAAPVVHALLGAKWDGAILPLRILAAYNFVRLITSPAGDLFRGIGRSTLGLVAAACFLVFATSALLVLVPRHGTAGAALAMLIAILLTGSIMIALVMHAVDLRLRAFGRALVRPALPSVPLALALLALLPATDNLRPLVALAVLVAAGALAYAAGVVMFARPLVVPIWAAFRRA